ncbi:hypothetical protein BDM02DRAFT_3114039 [Thelephora ganbajun]|uniref:Uncharacterized protein n=1 Tax=Thelephora ganbajun TaxID=370292 RepID=A0ACB6ZIP0_THEGA|nr:hypothetical protein BDM02DRAFT_3114039 [Thelephora ganbajun]
MVLDPKSRVSSSGSTNYSDSGYAPSSGSAPRRRELPLFPFFPSLQNVLRHPRILECLLLFISYGDFSALTSSCSELRNLMQKPAFKDTILSCFLPGFRSLLRFKTPELFVDVRATVGDLNIFHLSNKIGLHVYPIHALQFGTRFNEVYQLKLLPPFNLLNRN